jgi:hypothetical protein
VFAPQPYEHLASVFRQFGQSEDTIDILIAKEDDSEHSFIGRIGHWISKFIFDHGYRPWKTARLALWTIIMGTIVFHVSNRWQLIVPSRDDAYQSETSSTPWRIIVPSWYARRWPTSTCTPEAPSTLKDQYPPFNAFVYSVDLFTPLIDLHQGDYWTAGANRGPRVLWGKVTLGQLVRVYALCHIVVGWTLSTFLAIGLSGLIRQQ